MGAIKVHTYNARTSQEDTILSQTEMMERSTSSTDAAGALVANEKSEAGAVLTVALASGREMMDQFVMRQPMYMAPRSITKWNHAVN